jgi:hypothetical protein
MMFRNLIHSNLAVHVQTALSDSADSKQHSELVYQLQNCVEVSVAVNLIIPLKHDSEQFRGKEQSQCLRLCVRACVCVGGG